MFLSAVIEARKTKRVMKVPKGTSDYQATWIVDEDQDGIGEMSDESSDDDDDDMMDEAMDGEDEDNMSQVHIESIFGAFIAPICTHMTKRNLIIDVFYCRTLSNQIYVYSAKS